MCRGVGGRWGVREAAGGRVEFLPVEREREVRRRVRSEGRQVVREGRYGVWGGVGRAGVKENKIREEERQGAAEERRARRCKW